MANSKYHSRKTTIGGQTFDSAKEARRWQELKLLERAGKISGLQRQVTYTLVPTQRREDGKTLERAVTYRADFVYTDAEGKAHIEDVKGVRTDAYVIKRKLMLWVYGIRVEEV